MSNTLYNLKIPNMDLKIVQDIFYEVQQAIGNKMSWVIIDVHSGSDTIIQGNTSKHIVIGVTEYGKIIKGGRNDKEAKTSKVSGKVKKK